MVSLPFPEKGANNVFFPDTIVFSWLQVKNGGFVPLVRFLLGGFRRPRSI